MADIPAPVKREPLSKFDFATLFLAQGGKCAKCGCKLERGKVRDEHLQALHLGGTNELSNRALWCLACTKPKDKTDKQRIGKVKRLNGTTSSQASRRAERGPQIQSRKFKKRGMVEQTNQKWLPLSFQIFQNVRRVSPDVARVVPYETHTVIDLGKLDCDEREQADDRYPDGGKDQFPTHSLTPRPNSQSGQLLCGEEK